MDQYFLVLCQNKTLTIWSLHFDVLHHGRAIFRKFRPTLKPSIVKRNKFLKFITFYDIYSQLLQLSMKFTANFYNFLWSTANFTSLYESYNLFLQLSMKSTAHFYNFLWNLVKFYKILWHLQPNFAIFYEIYSQILVLAAEFIEGSEFHKCGKF